MIYGILCLKGDSGKQKQRNYQCCFFPLALSSRSSSSFITLMSCSLIVEPRRAHSALKRSLRSRGTSLIVSITPPMSISIAECA